MNNFYKDFGEFYTFLFHFCQFIWLLASDLKSYTQTVCLTLPRQTSEIKDFVQDMRSSY